MSFLGHLSWCSSTTGPRSLARLLQKAHAVDDHQRALFL